MDDNEIQVCDTFRAFEQIVAPDTRGIGIFHTTDLQNWQKYVDDRLMPSPSIPVEIRIQIETVKNLFLYSWFVYRFGMVAKNQMLNVTELALKKKFEIEGLRAPSGLRGKLEKALADGWFDDSSFPHFEEPRGKEVSTLMIEGIVGLRNSLNHGSTMLLDPLNLLEFARECLVIIEALFQGEKAKRSDIVATPKAKGSTG